MKKTRTIFVGTIQFPLLVNDVRIIDPCYDISDDIINYSVLGEFLGGTYDCYATISQEGDWWGDRVASLKIVRHNDAAINFEDDLNGIAVDSGQAGFFLKGKYDDNASSKIWYDSVCKITTKDDNCGIVDNWGVVSSTGFGDGYYKVLVSKVKDVAYGEYLNGAEIIFIEDEDDYDEEN